MKKKKIENQEDVMTLLEKLYEKSICGIPAVSKPIEQLASLRSIPNFTCIRPCNEQETKYAYKYALTCSSPCALVLTRQDLVTKHLCEYNDFSKGAYYVINNENASYTIIATGSEVNLAIECAKALEQQGKLVNVVSMPMMNVFDKQTKKYQKHILRSGHSKTISIDGSRVYWC